MFITWMTGVLHGLAGCCGRNATDWLYLLVYPLFTLIMMALGSCHLTCHR